METARQESREHPGAKESPGATEFPSVRRLARQLLTEFGEQAPAIARTRARESRTGNEAQTWLRVLEAVKSLSPGEASPR